MGGGSSSLHRLRKILIIRAYNSRPEGITLEEQFLKFTEVDQKGQRVLTVSAIKQALGLKPNDKSALWLDELVKTYLSNQSLPAPSEKKRSLSSKSLAFEAFLDFLETGRPPSEAANMPQAPSSSQTPKKPPKAPSTAAERAGQSLGKGAKTKTSAAAEPKVPSGTPLRKVVKRQETDPHIRAYRAHPTRPELLAKINQTMYPDVIRALGFQFLSKCRALLPHKGTTLSLHGRDSYRKPWVSRPVWQKREIVLQERIVVYTTVDEEGNIQELVETEKSQTEVLHMECKDTGEFAHREKTDYEQTETFNKEIVLAERGNEEYLHLKSLVDEYEHLESNMPQRNRPPAEEPPPVDDSYNAKDMPDFQDDPDASFRMNAEDPDASFRMNSSKDEGQMPSGMDAEILLDDSMAAAVEEPETNVHADDFKWSAKENKESMHDDNPDGMNSYAAEFLDDKSFPKPIVIELIDESKEEQAKGNAGLGWQPCQSID